MSMSIQEINVMYKALCQMAVRKKLKDGYGPKELTVSSGEKDKSTTLNKSLGTHKRS